MRYYSKCIMCGSKIIQNNVGGKRLYCNNCKKIKQKEHNIKFVNKVKKEKQNVNKKLHISYKNQKLIIEKYYSIQALKYILKADSQSVNNLVTKIRKMQYNKQIIIKRGHWTKQDVYQMHNACFYHYEKLINLLLDKLKDKSIKKYHEKYKKWLNALKNHNKLCVKQECLERIYK